LGERATLPEIHELTTRLERTSVQRRPALATDSLERDTGFEGDSARLGSSSERENTSFAPPRPSLSERAEDAKARAATVHGDSSGARRAASEPTSPPTEEELLAALVKATIAGDRSVAEILALELETRREAKSAGAMVIDLAASRRNRAR
jgi:hypothetical protein